MTGPSSWKPISAVVRRLRYCAVFASLAVSATGWGRHVERPFTFKLFTADIFSYDPYEDSSHPHAMARSLREVLVGAESSVEMAVYGVRNQAWIEETLKDARKRRINVQAVVDQSDGELGEWNAENFFYPDTPKLKRILGAKNILPDISASGTIRKSIMHNKFVVVDGRYVWTGSTNLSDTCIGREMNANVSLLIDAPELAGTFSAEFAQMFHDKRFSLAKKHVPVDVLQFSDGTRVTSLFSPQHSPLDRAVLPLIENTTRKLDLAIFFLTERRVIDALQRAAKRGVKVRIIHDGLAAAHPDSHVKALQMVGIDVRVENWAGKMHMKTAISDGVHTVVGSMNWSQSGNLKNDENTLLIENNRSLARGLTTYFDQLWDSLESRQGNERALGLRLEDGLHELLRSAVHGKDFYPATWHTLRNGARPSPTNDSDS